ncbi:MAG: single-stranded-DNA-specific exonuclease RecJ [Deltaproteobacteria bacterium]|nr:single-stranded-DNA-specific exonuclease RecJ [Candidatus Anaeroferrophillacea bacterium]
MSDAGDSRVPAGRPASSWEVAAVDSRQCSDLCGELGISPLLAHLLVTRDIFSAADADRFLRPELQSLPDPLSLRGMGEAVDRLMHACRRREPLLVYGDYDADGITGTAVLVRFFRDLGLPVSGFIPSRVEHGYGLHADVLEGYHRRGIGLAVSVDCGIADVEVIAGAAARGQEVIVTDHHEPPESLPAAAAAIINPKQPGCPYPDKNLAGVGVAFNLIIALRRALRRDRLLPREINLKRYLDLVAIGTIADVVPLVGVNRILVRHGLEELQQCARPGIRALVDAGVRPANRAAGITAQDVAFRLAPQLNAAGRMADAGLALELLLCDDSGRSRELVRELQRLNDLRRRYEERMLGEAQNILERSGVGGEPVLVLASPDWHEGVVGIVASKLSEQYHRPAMLISLDGRGHGKASGRSIPGVHLLEVLRETAELLERHGGHRMAVGFSIREDNIDTFRRTVNQVYRKRYGGQSFSPVVHIDGEVQLAHLSFAALEEIGHLAPFGYGNPEPVLAARDLTIRQSTVVGRNHLRLQLADDSASLNAIGFNMGDAPVRPGDRIDAAFTPQFNDWNGVRSIQLNLRAIRP